MNTPEQIYLTPNPDPFDDGGEILWSPSREYAEDVEYVRLDRVQNILCRANVEAIVPLPYAWEDDLLGFVAAMRYKLHENRHKGHWGGLSSANLWTRLMEEASELLDASKTGTPGDVVREAADVANFAMMIAANAVRERARRKGSLL